MSSHEPDRRVRRCGSASMRTTWCTANHPRPAQPEARASPATDLSNIRSEPVQLAPALRGRVSSCLRVANARLSVQALGTSVEVEFAGEGFQCCGEVVPVGTVGHLVDRVDEMAAEVVPLLACSFDEQDRDGKYTSLPGCLEDGCAV